MARKKKTSSRKNIFLGVGILFLLVVMSYFGGLFSLEGTGATIFSIDQVETFGSSDSTEWVIALSMNDGSEKVVGEFDQETLSRYNLESVPASKFRVEFELKNPVCEYDIVKDRNVVGDLYYTFVTEQCLANVCPYLDVDLDDVIRHCESGGGLGQIPAVSSENCDRMVDLKQLGGSYTEWCYWMPEESNVDAPGECRDSVVEREVTVTNNPAGCGRTRETITTTTARISEGETGGDWQVMSSGIVPDYNLYRVSSAEEFGYEAVVTVVIDDSEETFECIIDPVTKSCELGDFGTVKFAGNLLADKGCPDPANDVMLLRDLDTMEWSETDANIGSSLASYLTTLNRIMESNIDYYTFTAIPETETITSSSISGRGCDPAVGNPIFSEITALNGLVKKIPNEKPPYMGYDCKVDNDNKYVCDTGSSVVYPLLKLSVKASKVGILYNEGKPEILGISSVESNALDSRYSENVELDPNELSKIYVGIKNVGEQKDSFDVSLDCPFPVSQQSSRISVDSQSSDVATLLISGDGLVQKCKAKAVSVNNPDNSDDKEISVVINPTCDIYGVPEDELIYTEFGCYPQPNYPDVACKNDEFYLESLDRCVPYSDISTGESRLDILEEVAQTDCNRQCNGNKECVMSCLDSGNVKPVCTGVGEMMTLNDFLCDYENQPNLQLPGRLQDKVWLDVPVCDYVCEFGKSGQDCMQVSDMKYDYSTNRPDWAILKESSKVCETCFDGVQNQDEEGVDCGGVCEDVYGGDKSCDKLRAPDHCFNHLVDGDEYCVTNDCESEFGVIKPDCGGSCDFGCDEKQTGIFGDVFKSSGSVLGLIVIVSFLMLIAGLLYFRKKKSKRGRRR
mgnify:FL=1